LLSDGSSLTARQVAIQAGAAGHEVHVVSPDPLCLARWTRHVRRIHRAPAYGRDPFAWLEATLEVLRGGFDVLLPTHEQVAVLAREAVRVNETGVAMAVPSFSSLCRVQDKLSASVTLAEVGLAQPASRVVSTIDELLSVELPVFVKRPIGTASAGVHWASDRKVLARIANELDVEEALADGGLLVQQPADGALMMVQAVYAAGELAAWHANLRSSLGPRGGASRKRGVRPAAIKDDLERLGAALGWHGAISLDAVLTPEGPLYIDVNPRLVEPGNAWRSGVDLVETLLRVTTDRAHPVQFGRTDVATHQLISALLGMGEQGRPRRAVLAELAAAVLRRGPYRDSNEELTPLRGDLQAAIPLVAIGAALLASPLLWRTFASSAVENYALTTQAWRAIHGPNVPVPALATGTERSQ